MINHPNRSKSSQGTDVPVTRELAQKVLELVDHGLVSGIGAPEPGKMCVEAAVCYAMGLPHGDRPTCVAPALRALQVRLNDSCWSSDMARAKGLRRLAIAQLGSAGSLDESEFIERVLGVVVRKTLPSAFRVVAATLDDARKAKWLDLAQRCETAREARQIFLEFRENASAASAAASADAASADAYAAAADAAAVAADAYAYASAAAYADAAAYAVSAYAAYASAAADAYASAADADAAAYKKKTTVARDKSLAAFCEEVVQVLIGMKAPGCAFLDLAEISAA
jgi:hypothetical protein